MTLPATGPLSFSMINVELGFPANQTISLNDAAVRKLAGKPSGAISFADLRGKANTFTFVSAIAANTQNYSIRAAALAAGWDGVVALLATITVNSGVVVGSTLAANPAFDTGSGIPSGSVLNLINQGTITGAGGAGGQGSTKPGQAFPFIPGAPGSPGSAGGTALKAQFAISITNNATIAGGGGGGGGGGASAVDSSGTGGGGGGGAGAAVGSGGAAGSPDSFAGAPGTLSVGGAIGGGGDGTGGNGGVGGGPGLAGAVGQTPTLGTITGTAGGAGGAAGSYVVGNSNVTWAVAGTRLGSAV
jgi:hypothetical protein